MTVTDSRSGSLACPPRYGTSRTPGRLTLGPRVAEIAAGLGKPFLPWQRFVVDVALELGDDGELAYSSVVVVVMRQQGKSELLFPVQTHRCVGFGPMQRVLYTTQTADKARERWRDVWGVRLADSPFAGLYTSRYQRNSEAFMWQNGSMWGPGSTTGKTAGTGDTIDLGVMDEYWSREDDRTELGMRPAMQTRVNHQLWKASMVPGPSRATKEDWRPLLRTMTAGRSQVEAGVNTGTAYFEWSAPPDSDPKDPATWWASMPGLGLITPEKTIRDDMAAFDLADFMAEYLGIIPEGGTKRWTTIGERTWADCKDEDSYPGGSSIAFGIDTSPEQDWTSIVMASLRNDGDVHLEVVDRRPGLTWAEARIEELVEKWAPACIGISRSSAAYALAEPIRNAHPEVKLKLFNQTELAAACNRFYAATGEVQNAEVAYRVRHLGDPDLTNAVGTAGRVFVGNVWRWQRTGKTDISALYGATVAVGAGESADWAGGGYEIMESLG